MGLGWGGSRPLPGVGRPADVLRAAQIQELNHIRDFQAAYGSVWAVSTG